jgi:oxalate---CoA ligase
VGRSIAVSVVSEHRVLEPGGLRSISEIIRFWADTTPKAVAIEGLGGGPLTYAGLCRQLTALELDLRGFGIGHGDRVALVLDDGPELAVAFLAIASAASCAPLNPAYREQELDFYLADLSASAVIVRTGRAPAARAAAERLGLVVLELELATDGTCTLRGTGNAAVHGEHQSEDAALLLHTSGTTARPKLVPLTETNLCASATAVATSLELTAEDRGLAVMPLFHIHGLVASVLAPLTSGSTIVATPGFDGIRFLEWLDATHPTWYTAVPAMHMSILDRAQRDPSRVRDVGLRFVRSSSAPLPIAILEGLESVFGCPVVEAYGMTEAAHQMAANPLPPGVRKAGSVGPPAGPEIAVLDDEGRELDRGEVGELAVRGTSVFAGYERNHDANRESFSNGWFRTGDQGYLDHDGYVFLRGRLKEIVNRGGEKVSPREVEEILLTHPSVADAVVFAQPHAQLGEEVAAALVLGGGATTTTTELQGFAAARLAPFKVPRTVVILDELPRGPTGKVQRVGLAGRLGLPVLEAPVQARAPYVEPRTALERHICDLFEELLEVERVGIGDDFFALGGDSLHVAQLLARIDEDRGATSETLASVLLRAPTVEQLAAYLEGATSTNGRVVAVEASGDGPSVFFFPTHEWAIVGVGALAQRLAEIGSVYTFQLAPDDVPAHLSIESLAEQLRAEMRVVQPEGPYHLVGLCFGGALALEIARMLETGGERVASLVLVNPIGEHPSRLRIAARWVAALARRRKRLAWLVRRYRVRRERGHIERGATQSDRQTLALSRAGRKYAPQPYSGAVTILAGADYATPRRFWDPFFSHLEWHRTPAGTGLLFRHPHLDEFAQQLTTLLAGDSAGVPRPTARRSSS